MTRTDTKGKDQLEAATPPQAEEAATAADDPFAGAQAPADDPFADSPAEAPPVVDREGTRLEGDGSSAEAPAAPVEAPAAPPVEEPPVEPTTPEPQPPATEPEPPAEAPPAPQEAPGGGEPPQEPPAATGAEDGEQGGDDQPEPQEAQQAKQLRLYKLLYQTGETTWEETPIPDEYVEVVQDEKGNSQRFLKARNNDHARKLAWVIHDRPAAGVTILPVPASSWKPKRIKPAPPAPERERLTIE